MSHHRMPDPKGRPREVAIGLVILSILAGVLLTRGGLPAASYAEVAEVEQERRPGRYDPEAPSDIDRGGTN